MISILTGAGSRPGTEGDNVESLGGGGGGGASSLCTKKLQFSQTRCLLYLPPLAGGLEGGGGAGVSY